MANVQPRELMGEGDVLAEGPVSVTGVEPEVGTSPAQPRRHLRCEHGRAVVCEPLVLAPEDREGAVGLLLPRPARDHLELSGVMEADVQRPVPAFRELAARASPSGTDRPVPVVDRTDHVAGQERLPAGLWPDTVGPLG